MNKWRDNCVRTNEGALAKYDRADKEYVSCKELLLKQKQEQDDSGETALRDLSQRLQTLVADTEPLLLSIVSTAFEDVREMHALLTCVCKSDPQPQEVKQAQAYFENSEVLRRKTKEHQGLV